MGTLVLKVAQILSSIVQQNCNLWDYWSWPSYYPLYETGAMDLTILATLYPCMYSLYCKL